MKDNELVNFAIYILQKNDLINVFRSNLQSLIKKLEKEENIKTIEKLINSLIFKIAISKDVEKFRDKLRELSKGFHKRLESKYADLNEKEKNLAIYLKLNLSSKQIAIFLDISPESVDKKRYRLRKKIGLPKDANLVEFFNTI